MWRCLLEGRTTLSVDGVTRIYRVTARYVYGLDRPPAIDEKWCPIKTGVRAGT